MALIKSSNKSLSTLFSLIVISIISLIFSSQVNALKINSDGSVTGNKQGSVLSQQDSSREVEDEDVEENEERDESDENQDTDEKDEHGNKSQKEDKDKQDDEEDEDEKEEETGSVSSKNEMKFELEKENGKTKIKVKKPDGEEIEYEEEIEIEESSKTARIKIKARENRFIFEKNRIRAGTNFPLSVDLETNELIVTTPQGEKRVTILPDEAINNLLRNNILDTVVGIEQDIEGKEGDVEEATEEAELKESEYEEETELIFENGKLSYKVKGMKEGKFLGFLKVELPRTALVSAETGELLELQHSFFNRFLNVLSV